MALTLGNASSPNQLAMYMDSVFGISLQEYRSELADNIGAANAFLHYIMKSDQYESAPGGTFIQEPLMTALSPADSYDGYDPLPDTTTEGVTDALYEWRQMATPISYSMREVILNKHRIVDLVKTRIKQGELGIQEAWAQHFMWGSLGNSSGTSIEAARVSGANGSTGINPIATFIKKDPTSATNGTVGGIDQSNAANAFWRNAKKSTSASTSTDYMADFNNIFNLCALGTGGKPKIVLLDQTSYELFCMAYWVKYKAEAPDVNEEGFPFEARKFKGAKIVMDDKVPDYQTDAIPSLVAGNGDPASLTKGSAIFINPQFFKIRYITGRDFEMLEDENGKRFAKPIRGDSRLGHVGWMGNTTCSNRRKQGVLYNIARTMTYS